MYLYNVATYIILNIPPLFSRRDITFFSLKVGEILHSIPHVSQLNAHSPFSG
jgi:hypothetical protein